MNEKGLILWLFWVTHDLLIEQQVERITHAHAGDVGGDVREAAFVVAARQVQVQPGDGFVHEAV